MGWAIVNSPRIALHDRKLKHDFTDELSHYVSVPASASGAPGEMIRSRSGTFYAYANAPKGNREGISDFRVYVDRNWNSLSAACLGRTEPGVRDAETFAKTVDHSMTMRGHIVSNEQPVPVQIGQLRAWRTSKELVSGKRLVDWYFDHSGWAFVAGVLVVAGDPVAAERAALDVLETWRWTDVGSEDS
jgi:hypothetical protein